MDKTQGELRYLQGRLSALEAALKALLTASPPQTHANVLQILEMDEPESQEEIHPFALEGMKDGRREVMSLLQSLRNLTS